MKHSAGSRSVMSEWLESWKCRFYGGMPHSEIAEAIGVSTRTVERE